MIQMPTVRLEVEGMKHQVVHHLGKFHEDVEKHVGEEVEKALRRMDWQDEIQRLVTSLVKDAVVRSVESYFRMGEGRRLVDHIVGEAMPKLAAPSESDHDS